MKFQALCKIIYNDKIGNEFFHLKIHTPEIALHSRPGQFVHIRVNDALTPLLRRPMSIFNADKNNIEIIYRLRGEGTHALAGRKKGELLDIIGPLGNGFNTKNKTGVYSFLAGGGMGLVPLFYLAKKLKQGKQPFKIFAGARSKTELAAIKFFKNTERIVNIATDDGSLGFKGTIVGLLAAYFKKEAIIDKNKIKIYSCGPRPMLKALQKFADKYNINLEISLEEYMGCGVGACLSCACKTADNQYKRVCVEGPVFNANEVIL